MAEQKDWLGLLSQTWPAKMGMAAWNAAKLPGDVYAGRVDPMSDEGIGRAADLAGLVMGGAYGAAPAVKNASGMGIKAYHGSPHDFDRFDLSKIGTGEGAQAYGHGLYFADNENVARTYQSKVSAMHGREAPTIGGQPIDWNDPVQTAAFELMRHNGDREAAAEFFERTFRVGSPVPGILRGGQPLPAVKPPGRMYEVDINAHPDQFLDWDKPLGQQPQEIGSAVQRAVAARYGDKPPLSGGPSIIARNYDAIMSGNFDAIGGDIALKQAGGVKGPEAASARLREAGIPGIKYLDQGSRAAGDGSRNYVVFDDSLINILRKYGIAGLGVLGAGNLPIPESQAPVLSQ